MKIRTLVASIATSEAAVVSHNCLLRLHICLCSLTTQVTLGTVESKGSQGAGLYI